VQKLRSALCALVIRFFRTRNERKHPQ